MAGPVPQLVFIHLPKTGGMSLHATIAAALPAAATLRIGTTAEHAAFVAQDRGALARFRFVSGHVSLAEALPRAAPGARFVTLLRDPVARLLSAFNYMATWTAHPLHATFRNRGFAEFILESGDNLAGEACRQLTGQPSAAQAIEVLQQRYAMVATTGRIATLAEAAAGWLAVPTTPLRRENQTPGQGRVTLDSRSCEVLLDVTREDRALYRHVAEQHGGLLRNRQAGG
jgi:hypothetical protein